MRGSRYLKVRGVFLRAFREVTKIKGKHKKEKYVADTLNDIERIINTCNICGTELTREFLGSGAPPNSKLIGECILLHCKECNIYSYELRINNIRPEIVDISREDYNKEYNSSTIENPNLYNEVCFDVYYNACQKLYKSEEYNIIE